MAENGRRRIVGHFDQTSCTSDIYFSPRAVHSRSPFGTQTLGYPVYQSQ